MKKNNIANLLKFDLDHQDLKIIDQRLIDDCKVIAKLELSYLLLCNDSNYPWLILVPNISGVYDLTDLEFSKQQILLKEINYCAEFLKQNFQVDKLNIASLGNVVKQLHVHVIARSKNDLAFPKPVFGFADPKKYQDFELNQIIKKIKDYLTLKYS